ncbi:MAG: hypothetical protein Q7U97_02545 [Rhodocyclaceae bacterium]|nr:hypothetical protein [Rhodocyclaceae bacterium]
MSAPIRLVATAAFFGVAVPFVMSVAFFSFGSLVAFQHGDHAGTLEAFSSAFANWCSEFKGFYRGTLKAALAGAIFSGVFGHLAITGCSFSMRDLRFFVGGGSVAILFVAFPLSDYSLPLLEIPLWIIFAGFSGAAVGMAIPQALLPDIPFRERDVDV